MPETAYIYGGFISKVLNKEVDWLDDDIKVALVTSSYTPLQDSHNYWSDVVSFEVANGAGYTTGGISLSNKTSTYDTVTNTTSIDADNINWPSSSITARYAVVYDNSPGTNISKPLIGYVDFGENKSSSNGDYALQWDASGIILFTIS
jgi:hypothetical protein